MLFPTFTFAVFFAVVLCAGWLLHSKPVLWKLFMVAASYVFYAWWNPRFVLLLVASTFVNTICGRIIGGRSADAGSHVSARRAALRTAAKSPRPTTARRAALIVAVLYNLGVLGFFKYHDFFISSIEDGLQRLGMSVNLPLLRVVLPVGISFFTFQALSYVIDVHRGKIKTCGLLDFAVYLAFFPQLVAGPIVRASEFLPQLQRRLNPLDIDLARATILIASGLFKKVVISSYLAEALVDDVFGFPDRFSGLEILLALYGYSIQIYADFSGYTDIAIGVAILLGFRFPENFNQPYRATTIGDFWRRWHITLSSWLRDYLYIPLGGNRGGRTKRDRNLFLTMLLGGLWHGAAWPFVVWGAYQGTGLLVERRVEERFESAGSCATAAPPARNPLLTPLRWLITFHFICVGWLFFRSETLGDAANMIARLFTSFLSPAPEINNVFVGVIVFSLLAQMLSRQGLARLQVGISRLPVWLLVLGFGFWILLVDQFGPEGVAPFIYFQF